MLQPEDMNRNGAFGGRQIVYPNHPYTRNYALCWPATEISLIYDFLAYIVLLCFAPFVWLPALYLTTRHGWTSHSSNLLSSMKQNMEDLGDGFGLNKNDVLRFNCQSNVTNITNDLLSYEDCIGANWDLFIWRTLAAHFFIPFFVTLILHSRFKVHFQPVRAIKFRFLMFSEQLDHQKRFGFYCCFPATFGSADCQACEEDRRLYTLWPHRPDEADAYRLVQWYSTPLFIVFIWGSINVLIGIAEAELYCFFAMLILGPFTTLYYIYLLYKYNHCKSNTSVEEIKPQNVDVSI